MTEETVTTPVLYTTDCPKCKVLEAKLKAKNIDYLKCTDVDKMLEIGIRSAPFLRVGDKLMDFVKANEFINQQ